jgi:Cu/Ag efflux protein CusF
MKPPCAFALATALLTAALAAPPRTHAEAACCAAEPAPSTTPAVSATAAGHPLRGVIVAVLPDKSSLLVQHEEIPGVMAAMTMLLKVDATALAAAKKDTAITATLVKKADGWWLENVTPAPDSAYTGSE